jgi:cell volume regulation protein A
MAYMLTLLFISLVSVEGGQADIGAAALRFFVQLTLGAFGGWLFGKASVWMMNRLRVDNQSMYPILLLALVFLTFSATGLVGGNGFLAVYIAGLVVGNAKFQHKRNTVTFFDGFTWLFQIVLFLILGLLVNPRDLLPVAFFGALIGLFMIFVGRPISVFLSLAPFRKLSFKGRLYVSWVGLRGAVPIIFATYPLMDNVLHGKLIFNVVFMCTLVSLIVQGSSVAWMARVLGVGHIMPKEHDNFGLELTDEIKSSTTEMVIEPQMLAKGDRLMDMPLPESALVVMVKRGDNFFIPKGATRLAVGDKLLIITNREQELEALYAQFGVKEYSIKNND